MQESAECNAAKDTFGGRLTQDFVAERLNTSNFTDIREMDFPNLGIKNVDIGGGDVFTNLRRFDLHICTPEHNIARPSRTMPHAVVMPDQ